MVAPPSPLVFESQRLTHPGFLILGIGKVFYVAGIFGAFRYLNGASTAEIMAFLFKAYLSGAIILAALHRPWKSRKLMRVSMITKLSRISAAQVVSNFALIYGMSAVGPTRFLLLEHLNVIITQLVSLYLASQKIQGSRMQGCVIGLLGYFLCLWHDPTDSRVSNDTVQAYDENTFDLFVGICAIGTAQVIQLFTKKTERKLVDETGSLKRLQSVEFIISVPMVGFMWIMYSAFIPSMGSSASQGTLVTLCSLFLTIRTLLFAWQQQLQIPENAAMRCSVAICAGLATFLHLLHFDLSGSRPVAEAANTDAPGAPVQGVPGAPIQESGSGLALYTSAFLATTATFRFTAESGSVPVSTVFRVLATHLPQQKSSSIEEAVRRVFGHAETKTLALYFLANVCFMAVEFSYGLMSNSQSLMSDSVHMIYDCVAMFIGFACSYMAMQVPTKEELSFGYERLDVIGGFLNGIFLIMSTLSVFMCALERYFEPDKVHSAHLLVISLCQVILGGVGIKVFVQPPDSSQTKRRNRMSLNVQGVYLHILVGLCSSSSCAFSSLLSHYLGWHFVDPLFSFIMCLIVWPLGVGRLLRTSTTILLQRQPVELDQQISFGLRELQAMDHEVKVLHSRFWTVNLRHARGAIRVASKTEPAQLHQQMDLLDVRMTTETEIITEAG